MIHKLCAIIIALSLVPAGNISAAITWPKDLERHISPCNSARIEVNLPAGLTQDNARMHGVIVDEFFKKYLIYEPKPPCVLCADIYAKHTYGKSALLCTTLSLMLKAGGYFTKPINAAYIENINLFMQGSCALGLIFGFRAASIWIKHALQRPKHDTLDTTQHSSLPEDCANTLKRVMQLPNDTSTKHLYFKKLDDTHPVVRTQEQVAKYTLPLFQGYHSLDPVFTACAELKVQLENIKNKRDLAKWSNNTNPIWHFYTYLANDLFSPLRICIKYNTPSSEFPQYSQASLKNYKNGIIYYPPVINYAFAEALKRCNTDIETCIEDLESSNDLRKHFNAIVKFATGDDTLLLTAASTAQDIKRAYLAAAKVLHTDQLPHNAQLREALERIAQDNRMNIQDFFIALNNHYVNLLKKKELEREGIYTTCPANPC